MTLHFYFARKFLMTFLGILGGFSVFMWLVELLEHLRRFDTSETSFAVLAYMALLHLPQVLYQILTLVVLLATVMMFITLARTSELVISRATGRSAIRSLIAPILTAFALGVFTVAVINPVVATMSKRYNLEENRLRGSEQIVSISREGLWLRQGKTDQQIAIHADSANLDGTHLFEVTFYGFDQSSRPTFRIDAAEAVLETGAWSLQNAKRWSFSSAGNPEAEAELFPTLLLPSDLTRDQIRDSFGTPSGIPIWELPAFITALETAGFSARSHRVWLQSELCRPLSFVAMVLVGAIFTLRHTRFGHTGLMVLFAVLAGFTLFFTGNLTKVMADSGQIPVMLAVWSPPAAAILLALSMLLHFEDG
ncbi:LPS export ABC transporter permease LptG [Pseudoruegeria sp. SK021]|uniref:LPS export ABC transporter permease LptG n=1 Tax=Pseudoruegeria sp. SK021 TaxID=1933035 RepID=UPI000A22764D|nr:LPS export ABC transporter permease LptG [Pseudoruegeria sp. SK021]OSP55419.1 LPS export ABC transporter permease LptG [Pseudoruegeria sp. SK021]